MKPKKPIQRAIDVLIKSSVSDDALQGVFYTNDFRDGATEHLLDGHLTDSQGATRRFSGRLSGMQFVPVETRGAPAKVARDVALFLAYQWFLGIAERVAPARAESAARQGVMELWAAQDFTGVSEETHLRKRLKTGAAAVHGLSLLHYVCTSADPDGMVVAALEEVFDLRPGEYMGINGPCWLWQYGMEAAIQGSFTAGAQLTRA